MIRWLLGGLCILFGSWLADACPAQNPDIDVVHYDFELTLSDREDRIEGQANLECLLKGEDRKSFWLDLVSPDGNDKQRGMQVTKVEVDGNACVFRHQDNKLVIDFPDPETSKDPVTLKGPFTATIVYHGVPMDGLIIGTNQHGDRTFFSDNWPDRARHWIPTVDHPSDKATVRWSVTAPQHYKVIANGKRIGEPLLDGQQKKTSWRCDVPIPTKVMAVGAARFEVQEQEIGSISIEHWVFPEERDEGFRLLAPAREILEFYQDLLGPYPFTKLAHVQSKTRFGGMENATAIFYAEDAFQSGRSIETLIAHEVSHQWFGNDVTEADWPHLWLSEGFATYLANVFVERRKGTQAMQALLRQQRNVIYQFNRQQPLLSVVTHDQPASRLLNPNAYQKGAWVLHMLRCEIGDDAFFRGLRKFYASHRGGNVTTNDFRDVMESVADTRLESFFDQWLRRPDEPLVIWDSRYDKTEKRLTLILEQVQPGKAFRLPLEVAFRMGDRIQAESVVLRDRREVFSFEVAQNPDAMALDPRTRLLIQFQRQRVNLTEP